MNADDKEAYVLYRELQEGLGEGVDPERVRSRLKKLSSSWLASFLIQLQDAASKNREKRDSAQRVLKDMAMDAFDPAVAWLARDITPDMLVGRAKPSVVGRIGWGVSQCNVYCVLVHARVRQRLHYPFNNESAGRDLATALYAAAEKKSWDALSMLLELHTRAVPGLFELVYREEALAMLADAVQAKLPEAMYMQGKLLQDGVLVAKDSEQARQWFAQAAEAGSIDGKCALGLALLGECVNTGRLAGTQLAQARALLEEGCAAGHGPSFLGMVDLLKLTAAGKSGEINGEINDEIFMYRCKAVEHGMTEEVLPALLSELDAGNLHRLKDIQRLLELPALKNDPAARHQLAMRRMCSKGSAAASERSAAYKELETLAKFGYGPASASLAECLFFGLYGCETCWSCLRREETALHG